MTILTTESCENRLESNLQKDKKPSKNANNLWLTLMILFNLSYVVLQKKNVQVSLYTDHYNTAKKAEKWFFFLNPRLSPLTH